MSLDIPQFYHRNAGRSSCASSLTRIPRRVTIRYERLQVYRSAGPSAIRSGGSARVTQSATITQRHIADWLQEASTMRTCVASAPSVLRIPNAVNLRSTNPALNQWGTRSRAPHRADVRLALMSPRSRVQTRQTRPPNRCLYRRSPIGAGPPRTSPSPRAGGGSNSPNWAARLARRC
jgi:hypothetical protein